MGSDCGPLDSDHKWFRIDDVMVCLRCEKEQATVTLETKGGFL